MKVKLVNYSDWRGGAARASYRINMALHQAGIDSSMCVNESELGHSSIFTLQSKSHKFSTLINPYISRLITKSLSVEAENSISIIPSRWVNYLNSADVDIVHLNWINSEMLSIKDLSKIKKKILWTFHDMWPICGGGHIEYTDNWKNGYLNKTLGGQKTNFDRWMYKRKEKHWNFPMHVVTPSSWLKSCVIQSPLSKNWTVDVIPNPIDTKLWSKIDKNIARDMLGIPKDVPLIMFSAASSIADYNKGFDLLIDSLKYIRSDVALLLVGVGGLTEYPKVSNAIYSLGRLRDDLSLIIANSASDVVVVPSRIESFGQVASEAHACSTPVVAFSTTGLVDIVGHEITGYLAKPFDTEDLANGINSILNDSTKANFLSANARLKALQKWGYAKVSSEYINIYNSIM
jgi:glycosyltransferase involved in cell wall biosynthesis